MSSERAPSRWGVALAATFLPTTAATAALAVILAPAVGGLLFDRPPAIRFLPNVELRPEPAEQARYVLALAALTAPIEFDTIGTLADAIAARLRQVGYRPGPPDPVTGLTVWRATGDGDAPG